MHMLNKVSLSISYWPQVFSSVDKTDYECHEIWRKYTQQAISLNQNQAVALPGKTPSVPVWGFLIYRHRNVLVYSLIY